MLSRWLAWLVLGTATVSLALVGIAGARQMLEPPPPESLADLTEGIEAAGIACSSVLTAEVDGSTFICGEDEEAVFVIFRHRPLTGGSSGSYIPLKSLGADPGELSGDRFAVLGPYQTLVRVQKELGGQLQRLSSGQ